MDELKKLQDELLDAASK